MQEIAVKCRNLIKTYGDEEALVQALRGIDLQVHTGELLMIVGPSGCGKTTLLSIMTGILQQDSGECLIFGEDIQKLSLEKKTKFRKEHIGFVFQSLHLIPSLTAIENVSIPLLLSGYDRNKANMCAKILLEKVGLGHRTHALPSHMSGGEQQRVAICRGCVHNPQLIVCDEPTSTLDHQTGVQVLDLLRSLSVHENKALVVVTHDSRIFEFADRILKMDDGRIVGEFTQNNHE